MKRSNTDIGLRGCKKVCDIINSVFPKGKSREVKPSKTSGRYMKKGDLCVHDMHELSGFCIEVKNEKEWHMTDNIIQAKEQARKMQKDWMLINSLDNMEGSDDCVVTLDLRTFMELLK